jgi:proliferating cell nuclear antigen PCNA
MKEVANVLSNVGYQDISLIFSPTKVGSQINIEAASPGSSTLSFMLAEPAFTSYECDEEVCVGLPTKALRCMMKHAEATDTLQISLGDSPYVALIELQSGDGLRLSCFALKLIWRSAAPTATHDMIADFTRNATSYNAVATLPSADLQRICNYLSEFGASVRIAATEESLCFSIVSTARHTEGVGKVTLSKREGARPVVLNVEEAVTAVFDLGTLSKMASVASALFGSVELGLSPGMPLVLQFPLQLEKRVSPQEKSGRLDFFLAPRVPDAPEDGSKDDVD